MNSKHVPEHRPQQPPAESVEDASERLASAIEAAEVGTFSYPVPLWEIFCNIKCKEHFWLPPDAQVDFDLFVQNTFTDGGSAVDSRQGPERFRGKW